MDERTLTARLKSWIDATLSAGDFGPIDGADNEVHVGGNPERHDLLVFKSGASYFNAEVKVPTNRLGDSPYRREVVKDAHDKAVEEGHQYFGTFNCATFVLWKTDMPGVPLHRRQLKRWPVVLPQHLANLEGPGATADFKAFLPVLIEELAILARGGPVPAITAEEDQIVQLLEDRLAVIVGLTLPAVVVAFDNDTPFRQRLKSWMTNDQGWQWDDSKAEELLTRATQIGCYLLMNQILFYEAMRRVFDELQQFDLNAATSGRGLKQRLKARFDDAMLISKDYETVFEAGVVTELAYLGDTAVSAWVGLASGVQDVNLAAYSSDLLGSIFERLLSPEERHRFGQHYTSPELADLLLAATVRSSRDVVMDPAAGGGTFLVRAYDRLRYLGEKDHLVLLSQIYGNDVSGFATHLSTVNLAVRQLAREENYPRVGTHDFLDLDPGKPLLRLPLEGQDRVIETPKSVGAMVGNPPYIKRHNIGREQRQSAERSLLRNPLHVKLHGHSDLHAYFWPQAARYLEPGGRLAFLTSSTWLETTSGTSLKAFLKGRFRIRLIAQSSAEPWFIGVRVGTIATVLVRDDDDLSRDNNEVTFATIRHPLSSLLGGRSDAGRWKRVEKLLDSLLTGKSSQDATIYRVKQVLLDADESWGVPLRAPAIFSKFIELPKVRALDDSFEIGVAPILGDKEWFVVDDVTNSVTDLELAEHGISRKQIAGPSPKYRFVAGFNGWRGPIESRFIGRAARGPKAQPSRVLHSGDGDLVVLIPQAAKVKGTKVGEYINWGESHNVHKKAYVAARAKWYSIEEKPRAPIIMPSSAAFAWKVWENPHRQTYTTRPNSYLTPRGDLSLEAALAVLNSTWTYLAATSAAGNVGVEGVLRFGGRTQFLRLRVVDAQSASDEQKSRLADLWKEMRRADVLDFPPAGKEQLTGWRRELDELVAVIAGAKGKVEAGELVDELYKWVRNFVGNREGVESIAVAGRRQVVRRTGRATQLASQAVAAADLKWPWTRAHITSDWLRFRLPARLYADDQPQLFGPTGTVQQPNEVMFGDEWVQFQTQAEADVVRGLGRGDLLTKQMIIPGGAVAAEWVVPIRDFVLGVPERIREEVDQRVSPDDPQYGEIYALALSIATENLRRQVDAISTQAIAEIPLIQAVSA